MTAEVKFSVDRDELRQAIEEMVALQVRAVATTIRQVEALIEAEAEPHCAYGPPECPVCTARSVLLEKFRSLLETSERRGDSAGGGDLDARHSSDPGRPGLVTPDP